MKRSLFVIIFGILILGSSCSKKLDWKNPLDPVNDLPPNVPVNYQPHDGTQGVNPNNAYFFFFVSDPNPGDSVVSCDVYLGLVNPPPYYIQATYDANGGNPLYGCNILNLQPSVEYYWYIILRDNHGKTATSPIWSFTTGSI